MTELAPFMSARSGLWGTEGIFNLFYFRRPEDADAYQAIHGGFVIQTSSSIWRVAIKEHD